MGIDSHLLNPHELCTTYLQANLAAGATSSSTVVRETHPLQDITRSVYAKKYYQSDTVYSYSYIDQITTMMGATREKNKRETSRRIQQK